MDSRWIEFNNPSMLTLTAFDDEKENERISSTSHIEITEKIFKEFSN